MKYNYGTMYAFKAHFICGLLSNLVVIVILTMMTVSHVATRTTSGPNSDSDRIAIYGNDRNNNQEIHTTTHLPNMDVSRLAVRSNDKRWGEEHELGDDIARTRHHGNSDDGDAPSDKGVWLIEHAALVDAEEIQRPTVAPVLSQSHPIATANREQLREQFRRQLLNARTIDDVARILNGDDHTQPQIGARTLNTGDHHSNQRDRAHSNRRRGGYGRSRGYHSRRRNHDNPMLADDPGRRRAHTEDERHMMSLAQAHFLEQEADKEFFRCHRPEAEVINIRNHSSSPNEDYIPACAKVYRCRRHHGCCNETSMCGPVETSLVTVHVFVMKYNINKNTTETEYTVKAFTFENHTECGCKPISLIKHRCLPCPFPFRSSIINTTHCRCDCMDGDADCVNIKKGMAALTEAKIKCVNDGECLAPSCRPRRYYDYGEGTCLSHDHPRREKYSSRVNRGHVVHEGHMGQGHEGVAEGVVGSGEGIDERT